MNQITAQELYLKLINNYKLIGKIGIILFTIDDLSVKVTSRDSVGNLLQDWLRDWMKRENISFEVNPNSQKFPDIYLNLTNKKQGLLEIKCFDYSRSANFDLANFESYCNSLLEDAYRLDSDYLVIGYTMVDHSITIKDIWLKKIWELSGASNSYPIKVQEKKQVIYNLRPIVWYSKKLNSFKCFNSKEEFLKALNNTRYQYGKTRLDNNHWLKKVISNYKLHTGITLSI